MNEWGSENDLIRGGGRIRALVPSPNRAVRHLGRPPPGVSLSISLSLSFCLPPSPSLSLPLSLTPSPSLSLSLSNNAHRTGCRGGGSTALHSAPCTLHPAPCTLHPAPCTLHPAPCTPNLWGRRLGRLLGSCSRGSRADTLAPD